MTASAFFAPLIGGVIGYITNDIAIKMLFRPRKAIYIGSWKVPFTPGLIPQQKERIARSIGDVVSAQLLDTETLRAAVLSEESIDLLRTKITAFIDSFSTCEDTAEELAVRWFGQENFDRAAGAAESAIEELLLHKLTESNLGTEIVSRCMELLRGKLGFGLQSIFFQQDFMGMIESAIGSVIDELLQQLAPDLIHSEVQKLSQEMRDKRLCDIYAENQERIPELVDHLISLYEKLLGDNLDKLVQAVDISGIIRSKISAFDAEELEKLIFEIMKKELNAIVYLGALLGFLMGFLNLFLGRVE